MFHLGPNGVADLLILDMDQLILLVTFGVDMCQSTLRFIQSAL